MDLLTKYVWKELVIIINLILSLLNRISEKTHLPYRDGGQTIVCLYPPTYIKEMFIPEFSGISKNSWRNGTLLTSHIAVTQTLASINEWMSYIYTLYILKNNYIQMITICSRSEKTLIVCTVLIIMHLCKKVTLSQRVAYYCAMKALSLIYIEYYWCTENYSL